MVPLSDQKLLYKIRVAEIRQDNSTVYGALKTIEELPENVSLLAYMNKFSSEIIRKYESGFVRGDEVQVVNNTQVSSRGKKKTFICQRCGKRDKHPKEECPARDHTCKECGRTGHL